MIAMPIDKIKTGMKVGRTVYGSSGQILLAAGVLLSEKYLERLKELEINFLYIHDDNVGDIEVDEVISERTRVSAIKQTKEFMSNIKVGSELNVKEVNKVVNDVIDELLNQSSNIISLLDIRAHKDQMFAHSVNVAILSTIIGITLEYDQIKLRNLAAGALFHDIGKVRLAGEILNKSGELTAEEAIELQKHTYYGFEIIKKNQEMSLLSAHVALQHHERYDGKGYPRGGSGKDIHQFARIVAIANAYDNLTSDSPYRRRMFPHEAIEYIIANSGIEFDYEIVKIFLKSIAIFPIGCIIYLNSGEKGIVVKVNKNLPTRPVVRVIRDSNGNLIKPGYDIDLEHRTTYFITEIVEDGEI